MKLTARNTAPQRRDVFADFFDEFFTPDLPSSKLSPPVDIVENNDNYTVKADLPGMKQENIKIEIDDSILKITGERKHEETKDNEKKKYHYYERSYGFFERRFILPKDIDTEKIDAKYENGELFLTIPKTETKKPKEIKIK